MKGTSLLLRPEWSRRLGRAMDFPPLAQNYDRVTAVLADITDESAIPAYEMEVLRAAEQVRELYEGDARHAQIDWAILTDPARLDDDLSRDLRLLAEAAKVEAQPVLPPAGVPNASNRLTQAAINTEWERLAGVLWPGIDPWDALQAASIFAAQVLADALRDSPGVLADAEAWLATMADLAAKVGKDKRLPLWVAAWRVAVAIETLTDSPDEVLARVDADDTEPAILARQRALRDPMDLLTVADAGVVALARALADPEDVCSDSHVLITKGLVEAAFVGRHMTDEQCIALMGTDPEAAYGTLEAIIRLSCQMGLASRRPITTAMAIDRWWSTVP